MEKSGVGVRKGAWTKEEDTLLKNCIEKFGEGKWHKVPPRAGLNRCKKSCRLRWLNYLRPNLKRGYFTKDEIDLILRLHKLIGNRWSLIAGRLPGRTANDVKNFWNSRILKKSSSSLAGEKTRKKKTIIAEKNTIIKPQPRILSKSHVPVYSSEEVINKTSETKDEKKINPSSSATLMSQQDDWKNSNVEFSLINNVLSEKEVDECIRWWLETPVDGDGQIPVSFSDKGEGDGAFMEPAFSPSGQINPNVMEFNSVSFDVDVFDHLTTFE